MSQEIATRDRLTTEETAVAVPSDSESVKGVASWVSFVWQKTTNEALKDNIKAQGGTIPSFVISRAGFAQPLRNFRFHLLDLRTIATKVDESGQIVDAEPKIPQGLDKSEESRWAEHTFAVVAVVQGDTLVPAVVGLRSGARRALTNADNALADAKRPGWASKGEMQRIAAESTRFIEGRVVAVGSITPEKSQKTGRMMLVGRCSWTPSSASDCERFNKAASDPQFQADTEACFRAVDWKLKKLLSKEMEEAGDE